MKTKDFKPREDGSKLNLVAPWKWTKLWSLFHFAFQAGKGTKKRRDIDIGSAKTTKNTSILVGAFVFAGKGSLLSDDIMRVL